MKIPCGRILPAGTYAARVAPRGERRTNTKRIIADFKMPTYATSSLAGLHSGKWSGQASLETPNSIPGLLLNTTKLHVKILFSICS